MPVWLRVILILVLVFILIAATLVFFGYRWWSDNKGRLMDAAKRAEEEGEAFGRNVNASVCVDETLTRVKRCDGIPCELGTRLFLDGCLRTAARSPELCASMPARSEYLKRAQWTLDECARRNLAGDQRCSRVMQAVAIACDHEPSR